MDTSCDVSTSNCTLRMLRTWAETYPPSPGTLKHCYELVCFRGLERNPWLVWKPFRVSLRQRIPLSLRLPPGDSLALS
jgi:hypothetical protein